MKSVGKINNKLISSKQADSQLSENVYFIDIPLSGYLLSMNEVNLFRDYLCQNGMDPAFENLPKEGLNLQLRNFLFDCRCLKAIKRFENLIIFSLSWILGAQG